MRKILSVAVIGAIATLAACKKSTPATPAGASVMFVNGCAAVSTMDVSVGVNKLSGATNIALFKNSGYQNLAAGSDSIALINQGLALETSTQNFAVGGHYSVFLGGRVDKHALVVLTDTLTTPSSGNARVRFVNLVSDTLPINAYAGSTVLASRIGYQQTTSFMEVPTGSYTIKAGEADNIGTVVATSAQQLAAGKIYTVIFTGNVNGSGTSAFTLNVINNN
jgi:Domain of unknown function (DUF4397)